MCKPTDWHQADVSDDQNLEHDVLFEEDECHSNEESSEQENEWVESCSRLFKCLDVGNEGSELILEFSLVNFISMLLNEEVSEY